MLNFLTEGLESLARRIGLAEAGVPLDINGFHIGPSGFGVPDEYFDTLDNDGIPFSAKGADVLPLYAQQVAAASSIGHTVVYRRSIGWNGTKPPSGNPDVPEYHLPPAEAAAHHWSWHKTVIEATINKPETDELDLAITWIETINEVRKELEWADWLGHFATETAVLMNADGYKFAAFGFASGTPELGAWETPGMIRYLNYCADHPDEASIALHEYSFSTGSIWTKNMPDGSIADTTADDPEAGYLVGRFTELFDACDRLGIARPKAIITEWGWGSTEVPKPAVAMQHILSAGELYAKYPEIIGIAIWYLGGGFGGIATGTKALIQPLETLLLETTYPAPEMPPTEMPPTETPPTETPPAKIKHTIHLLPQDTALAELQDLATYLHPTRSAFTYSADVAHAVAYAGNDKSKVVVWDGHRWADDIFAWLHARGITTEARLFSEIGEPPTPDFQFTHWPTDYEVVTQTFGNNPGYYGQFGLPGHEGVDIRAPRDSNIYAVATGRVYEVVQADDGHSYGVRVRIRSGKYRHIYAHMVTGSVTVSVGDQVQGGQRLGRADSTGNIISGAHLHITLKHDDANEGGDMYAGYPYNIIDPTPFLLPFNPEWPNQPPEPPTPGRAPMGLHLRADPDDLVSPAEFNEFTIMQADWIKVLSAHPEWVINRLAGENPGATWIVRIFMDFGGRTITPEQFYNDTMNDTVRTVSALLANRVPLDRIYFEIHNEPNLVIEGLGVNWADGASFALWAKNVVALYARLWPTGKFGFPGLSPGDTVQGIRAQAHSFLDESLSRWDGWDWYGCHAYWSDDYEIDRAIGYVVTQRNIIKLRTAAPIILLTEASRNDRPATRSADHYASDYVYFASAMREIAQGITFYVGSGSGFRDEAWVTEGGISKGIAAAIAQIQIN